MQGAAGSGRLGPLCRRVEERRGAYYLLHPCLADPQVWRDVQGTTGRDGPAEAAVRPVVLELIARVADLPTARELAQVIRAARVGSPVAWHRLEQAWVRARRHGAEVADLLPEFRQAVAALAPRG